MRYSEKKPFSTANKSSPDSATLARTTSFSSTTIDMGVPAPISEHDEPNSLATKRRTPAVLQAVSSATLAAVSAPLSGTHHSVEAT